LSAPARRAPASRSRGPCGCGCGCANASAPGRPLRAGGAWPPKTGPDWPCECRPRPPRTASPLGERLRARNTAPSRQRLRRRPAYSRVGPRGPLRCRERRPAPTRRPVRSSHLGSCRPSRGRHDLEHGRGSLHLIGAISGSDTPRSAAARLTADFRSSRRYSVVYFMAIRCHRSRWRERALSRRRPHPRVPKLA